MEGIGAIQALYESGALGRLTLVILATRAQRDVIYRALRAMQREAGTHSLAHALELLLLNYLFRDLRKHLRFSSRTDRMTTVRLPIYADQLGVLFSALEDAGEAGAPDVGTALSAIALEFLEDPFGGPEDRPGPDPKRRCASGSRRDVPAAPGGRTGTRPTPPMAGGAVNGSVLPSPTWDFTAACDHRGVDDSPTHCLLPALELDAPGGITAWPGGSRTADESWDASEALFKRREERPCVSEPERLPFTTVPAFAEALGVSEQHLRNVARNRSRDYEIFWIPKRSGDWRRVTAPVKESGVRTIQDQIVELVLSQLPVSPIAFAVRGRSHIDAAKLHERSAVVAKFDIRNFHPSIRAQSVRRLFLEMGADEGLADLLMRLTCYDRRLAQGAPTSPKIAEALLAEVDQFAFDEGHRRNVTVTRFSDNFTLSGPSRRDVAELADSIRRALSSLGLRTHGFTVTPRCKSQRAHGLSLNNKAAIAKPYRRKVRDDVRRISRFGCADASRQKLLGRIAHVGRLHRDEAARLRAAVQAAPKLKEGG